MAHAYPPAPPTPSSSATNVSNVPTIVSNAQQVRHVQNARHRTTSIKENVTLTAIRYLSNTM